MSGDKGEKRRFILCGLNGGIGNVMQTIPFYLGMVKLFGPDRVDVVYVKEYETDSVRKCDLYPIEGGGDDTPRPSGTPLDRGDNKTPRTDIPTHVGDLRIREVSHRQFLDMLKGYEYSIKTPLFIYDKGADYIRDSLDDIRSRDSEYTLNMKILGYFEKYVEARHAVSLPKKKKRKMKRAWVISESWKDLKELGTYCVVHNGGLNEGTWKRKKYPYFEKLVKEIKKTKLFDNVICVGSKDEYIPGTVDMTGVTLRDTGRIIHDCAFYIGTDTGTYHIAGLMEKKGIVLGTMTDMKYKNWDKIFHASIEVIQDLAIECCPCQLGFFWRVGSDKCDDEICRRIPVSKIIAVLRDKSGS